MLLSLLVLFSACSTQSEVVQEEVTVPSDSTEDVTETIVEETLPVNNGEEPAEEEVLQIEVDGFNFGYTPEIISIPAGQKVRVVLTSSDGFHDFVVEGTDIATEKINTGGQTEIEFTIDEPGEYEFYCSVGQHRANGMVGTLIVE